MQKTLKVNNKKKSITFVTQDTQFIVVQTITYKKSNNQQGPPTGKSLKFKKHTEIGW